MRKVSFFSVAAWGRLLLLLALALGTALSASARVKHTRHARRHHRRIFIPKMLPTIIPDAREGYATVLRGRASWYGKYFQGMKTASGERYDRFQWTCAHKTLPFGTRLRVTNVKTGMTVVVRVADRGPFRHERILDLSEQAAKPLNLVELGAATVVAVIVPEDTPLGLADTPANLEDLQEADPQPHAPFTAYLLRQPATPALPASEAVADAPVIAAATPNAASTAATQLTLQAGTFNEDWQAEAQQARILAISPALDVRLVSTVQAGRRSKRVVIGRLDSWLTAEALRRNLQLWGITSRLHIDGEVGEHPAMAAAQLAATNCQ